MLKKIYSLVLISLAMTILLGSFGYTWADEDEDDSVDSEASGRFNKFEIRVIRPRFFSKTNSFEFGTQGIAVSNQTFIYSYLLSGILTYHFSEEIALELLAAGGNSIDKDDKLVLEKDFNIKTQIIRPVSIYTGSLLLTPIYGKFQLSSGRVIYIDTYFSLSAGMTGVDYNYDHCLRTGTGDEIKSNGVITYPSIGAGVGQRIFIKKSVAMKWDIRNSVFSIRNKDGQCVDNPDVEDTYSAHFNLTLQFGISKFF